MRFPTTLAALLLIAAALAGCAEDDNGNGNGSGVPTQAECEAQGLILGEEDGRPACVEPGPVAEAHVEGLPGTAPAYSRVEFQWVLHTRLDEAHAMDTQVRVSQQMGDEGLEGPDSFGERVERREHQDFSDGTSYEAEYRFGAPGVYYFRAYAEVQGEHIWSEPVAVTAEPVEPSSETVTVTIQVGSLLPVGGLDPSEATLGLGGGVLFENEDLVSYTVDWEAGPDGSRPESFTVPSLGSAGPVNLLAPGTYSYTASSDVAVLSGTVRVQAPS